MNYKHINLWIVVIFLCRQASGASPSQSAEEQEEFDCRARPRFLGYQLLDDDEESNIEPCLRAAGGIMSQNEELREKNVELKEENNALRNANNQLKAQIELLQMDKKELTSTLKDQGDRINAALDGVQTNYEEIVKEKVQMESKVMRQQKLISELQQVRVNFERDRTASSIQKNALQSERDSVFFTNSLLHSEKEEYKKQLEGLKGEITECKGQCAKKVIENMELQVQYEQLVKQIGDVARDVVGVPLTPTANSGLGGPAFAPLPPPQLFPGMYGPVMYGPWPLGVPQLPHIIPVQSPPPTNPFLGRNSKRTCWGVNE